MFFEYTATKLLLLNLPNDRTQPRPFKPKFQSTNPTKQRADPQSGVTFPRAAS